MLDTHGLVQLDPTNRSPVLEWARSNKLGLALPEKTRQYKKSQHGPSAFKEFLSRNFFAKPTASVLNQETTQYRGGYPNTNCKDTWVIKREKARFALPQQMVSPGPIRRCQPPYEPVRELPQVECQTQPQRTPLPPTSRSPLPQLLNVHVQFPHPQIPPLIC